MRRSALAARKVVADKMARCEGGREQTGSRPLDRDTSGGRHLTTPLPCARAAPDRQPAFQPDRQAVWRAALSCPPSNGAGRPAPRYDHLGSRGSAPTLSHLSVEGGRILVAEYDQIGRRHASGWLMRDEDRVSDNRRYPIHLSYFTKHPVLIGVISPMQQETAAEGSLRRIRAQISAESCMLRWAAIKLRPRAAWVLP